MNPGTLPAGVNNVSAIFSNISTLNYKSDIIISRLDLMQPGVITQSISFLIGAFVAIAFVIASKVRY